MHEKLKPFKHSQHFDTQFGDLETFQIESKTRVGMIPKKIQYCSIKLVG